jgi:diaminopimelate epimerase
MKFTKMQGIGNDFVVVDRIRDSIDLEDSSCLTKAVCDRKFGVGADGLILLERSNGRLVMRMFNPDGSESGMCGNGLRCVARLAADRGYESTAKFSIWLGGEEKAVSVRHNGLVTVDMGEPRLTRAALHMTGDPHQTFVDQPLDVDGTCFTATAVSMGNPHLVFFVPDVSQIELGTMGPKLEHHPDFLQRTNVHFAQTQGEDRIIQRTWERGAGITLACGSGACAVAVAGYITGRTQRSVEIELPGGELAIDYEETGHVFMTGPASYVFEGVWTGLSGASAEKSGK